MDSPRHAGQRSWACGPRILLVDGQELFLDGLCAILRQHEFAVAGCATSGAEALRQAQMRAPEAVLLEVHLPDGSGLALIRQLKQGDQPPQVVVLTADARGETLRAAVQQGADGYLLKALPSDLFARTLRGMLCGNAPIVPRPAGALEPPELERFAAADLPRGAADRPPLTHRQLEVASLAGAGYTYKEIAARLYLTPRTVKYHMGEIMQRLQLTTRAELIAYTRQHGLVP